MIKRKLRLLAGMVAARVLSYPRLRQLVLSALEMLPSAVEAGLRRMLAADMPGAALSVPEDPLFAGLSDREIACYRALRRRLAGRRSRATAGRPRLAYFSPLPPQRSGISHYSLMLIPRLARSYDIELIVDQNSVELPWPDDTYPVRNPAWFREHGHEFDRILYHVGNAPFHTHMFDMMEEWPGTVVLHDFFLGHVMAHINNTRPGHLAGRLYRERGFGALKALTGSSNREEVIWENPLNIDVLEHARGLIVHSRFSLALLDRHFGDFSIESHVIPHLREPAPLPDRDGARERLGIPRGAFLVCSFGYMTPTKLNDRLLEAFLSSRLADNDHCLLVFVGEKPSGAYGRALLSRIKHHPLKDRIHITGWASGEAFELYLAAADIAVQLRARSRGETSGAVIDCLNHGLPTIVNAHGAMADLPEDAVVMLEDRFSSDALARALERLHDDPALRTELAQRGRNAIATRHDPAHCAELYRNGIESIHRQWENSRGRMLDQALDGAAISDPESPALFDLARGLAATQTPRGAERQLLVDVSAIVRNDLGTGVERVVRAQLLELFRAPPTGYRVEPVYLHQANGHWQYHYGRLYGCRLLDVGAMSMGDRKVDVAPGDILYGPDLYHHGVIEAHRQGLFRTLKDRGVHIAMVVHDLLPITMPRHFPRNAPENHSRWLEAIAGCCDQLLCISDAAASDLRTWAEQQGMDRLPDIVVNHHGADIAASRPTRGLPRRANKVLRQLAGAPTFLMVGTIEPRKGHLQALAAFDLMWRQGANINLVIVGKEGWKNLPAHERSTIPAITRALDLHPRRNRQLFWLTDISDDYLEAVYCASDCLLAASEGEGFGLPLIEAAQHGLPIIARDIAVFREVAADTALYFSGDSPDAIAHIINEWLQLRQLDRLPDSRAMPHRTWRDNVDALKAILVGNPPASTAGMAPGILRAEDRVCGERHHHGE